MCRDTNEVPVLTIGRAYSASDAAAILGLGVSAFNKRVRKGQILPMFEDGERRFSGYVLAKHLGLPVSDDPRDYLPGAFIRDSFCGTADEWRIPRLGEDGWAIGPNKD